jgi:hypothetical protein
MAGSVFANAGRGAGSRLSRFLPSALALLSVGGVTLAVLAYGG